MKNPVPMIKEATPDKAIMPKAFVIEPEKTLHKLQKTITNIASDCVDNQLIIF